jgi:hypothetical protein
MNTEKFEECVKNKANSNVQRKLETFYRAVQTAFAELTGESWLSGDYIGRKANTSILQAMLKNETLTPKKDLPRFIWEKEEEEVRDKMFGMMDIMQQALISKPPAETDCKPIDNDEIPL